jgi:hypothetical protein
MRDLKRPAFADLLEFRLEAADPLARVPRRIKTELRP